MRINEVNKFIVDMAKKKSAWLSDIEGTMYLKNFGQIFISKAKVIMKRTPRSTFASIARKNSGEDFKYSVKSGMLKVTDVKAEKSFELKLPQGKSSH